ncbi:ABC transporter substrate-binding protein [Siccirubricoccus sp. KC 17139]|uniref:ABC transporter substrate-binding protein n=1 Tax=Siccirubricoccus soli TaxID=2899147 RepID=A0ABT1D3B2_9PROT|nr:CmpA/NrtA family ABC transporter substrate-binding protein [Siccirubricoccus soli]MCO6416413.1 ABC transporter substrate-binding protein [Siccirubricoccus soli]MCP2682547.1 ABC transporter substrate-binding protein [Siccirubricoccus soli]
MPLDSDSPLRPALKRPVLRTLRIGCMPLTDAAPLLVAEELGLFDSVGLRVTLSLEASWAAIRDKLAFGALDAAHLLAPLPLALAAGLDGVQAKLTVAAGIGANGNTITLSRALAQALGRFAPPLAAGAFARLVRQRAAAGEKALILAVAFPYSSDHYLLRHWLAAGGLDPDRDLRLVTVPPPMMAQRLQDGLIDGFCAGEPWGSQAAALGLGTIALSSGDIWPNHPEKVLAFDAGYAAQDPESAIACTAALIAAARWLEEPANQAAAVRILQRRAFPGFAAPTIAAAFDGTAQGLPQAAPLRFRTATLPRREQAAWFLRQMRRWGHVPAELANSAALAPWRPDIWRAAATRLREVEPPIASRPPADLPGTA